MPWKKTSANLPIYHFTRALFLSLQIIPLFSGCTYRFLLNISVNSRRHVQTLHELAADDSLHLVNLLVGHDMKSDGQQFTKFLGFDLVGHGGQAALRETFENFISYCPQSVPKN